MPHLSYQNWGFNSRSVQFRDKVLKTIPYNTIVSIPDRYNSERLWLRLFFPQIEVSIPDRYNSEKSSTDTSVRNWRVSIPDRYNSERATGDRLGLFRLGFNSRSVQFRDLDACFIEELPNVSIPDRYNSEDKLVTTIVEIPKFQFQIGTIQSFDARRNKRRSQSFNSRSVQFRELIQRITELTQVSFNSRSVQFRDYVFPDKWIECCVSIPDRYNSELSFEM